ncbi:MAG: glycosyltransferase [Victivallaceae bacterium]|nr:glycosyltransferase [Victivallaceae bacterium]
MKLSIYTRYDTLGASSRYRYFMYLDALRAAGWKTKIYPFFNNRYLKTLYGKGEKSRLSFMLATVKRLLKMLFAGKQLIIEYELLPFIPYKVERLLLKNRKYILNFDDDVWEKYRSKPMLADKFDLLATNAAGIIVANNMLWEICLKLNKNVLKIPTVVDIDLYCCDKPKFDRFTVVWIGTPVTYCFLEQHAEQLQAMAAEVDFELLVIAASSLEPRAVSGVNMRFVDWSQETETELLMRSHVGIMPLVNDTFARGKSAFKLIQYLAAGIPVIASPVGENCTVVNDEFNGFLANSQEEWVAALEQLATDKKLYNKFAKAAKKSAKQFSIQKYSPFMIKFLKEAFDS